MKTANKRKTHKANTVEKGTQTVDRLYYILIETVVMLPCASVYADGSRLQSDVVQFSIQLTYRTFSTTSHSAVIIAD